MRTPRTLLLILLLICPALCPGRAAAERPRTVTGILGAEDIETAMLREKIRNERIHTIFGIEFSVGTLGNQNVVVATTGKGMVNAAMTTTLLIDYFGPARVIFTGIAGGLDPEQKPGDVVIGTMTLQYNLEIVSGEGDQTIRVKDPATGKYDPPHFRADPHLLKLANEAAGRIIFSTIRTSEGKRKPEVVNGIIATGSNFFVASEALRQELRHRLKADAVEMEGAAVAQICCRQRIPCIVIRGLSDDAGPRAHSTAKHFKKLAARNAEHIVLEMLKLMSSGGGGITPEHRTGGREDEP